MDESADVVEGSKKGRSAKNAGPGTKSEALPEELLAILADHLVRINAAGVEVEMIPTITRKGVQCVGFLVMGVQVVEGRMRVLPENNEQ